MDIRFGWRVLRGHPRSTAISITTLAIAIAANSSILSLANAILFTRPAYPRASQVVMVTATAAPGAPTITGGEIVGAIAASRSFASAGVVAEDSFNVTAAGDVRRIQGAWVTPSIFTVVQLPPAAGRMLTSDDARSGAEPVAMISARFWRSVFQAAPSAVEMRLVIDAVPRRIVGVVPDALDVAEFADVFLPAAPAAGDVIARLADGAAPEAAAAELSAALAGANAPVVQVARITDSRAAEFGPIVPLLVGVVALVLLVACANVSGIQIARATLRRSEMGLRAALGAGPGRLLQQVATEQLIAAAAAGCAGLLLAMWSVEAMTRAIPVALPGWLRFQIDGRVVAMTMLLTLGAGLLCAVAPGLHAASTDVQDALRAGGRSGTPTASSWRARLVAAEVAVTVVLMVGAGLLVRTTSRLDRLDVGADLDGARMMKVTLPAAAYGPPDVRARFVDRLLNEIGGAPGVTAAGIASEVAGAVVSAPGGHAPAAGVRTYGVTTGYFSATGLRLRRGRSVSDSAMTEAVVSEEFARRTWGTDDAFGRVLALRPGAPPFTVIGVVGDLREPSLRGRGIEARPLPAVYVPFTSDPGATLTVVVRSTSDASAAKTAGDVERTLRRLDANVPVYGQRSLADDVMLPLWPIRVLARALALVALIAMVFASAGVYGVTDQIVASRTREMGIRAALGATAFDLLRTLLSTAARPVFVGAALGLVASFAAAPLLSVFIFGITTRDPGTYLAALSALALAAAIGTFVPAQTILRLQPGAALRHE